MEREQDSTAVPNHSDHTALKASEAGAYLANALGLPERISAQSMWTYARANAIPAIRIGRRVYFDTEKLREFLARGGTARKG
jgi:hypothetical protein